MELNDKIRGALFGYALGDALGVGTEFMSKSEAACYYPGGLRHFEDIIRDAHRSQWAPGEWTCDTEVIVRMAESVLRQGGFDVTDFAATLRDWCDEDPYDLCMPIRRCVGTPGWVNHPIAVTHHVWMEVGTFEASNEALGRALVTGMLSPRDTLDEDTRKAILLTHDDSRCVSSATIMAHVVHELLHHDREPEFDQLCDICKDIDHRTLPYLEAARDKKLADLEIDDEDTMNYTRKSMGAALWALWHLDNAADFIHLLVDEGGDADTNASLAGALAGIKYGYDALPAEKEKLLRRDYLHELADRIGEKIKEMR